jgi:outer membrane protein OmpA-like peptidoglycan-associated protein
LIENGVDSNSLSAVGKGESKIDARDDYQEIEIDGDVFKWNRNMRVEIKVIKY